MSIPEIEIEDHGRRAPEIAACVVGGLALEGAAIYSVLKPALGERLAGVFLAGLGAVVLTAASRLHFEDREP